MEGGDFDGGSPMQSLIENEISTTTQNIIEFLNYDTRSVPDLMKPDEVTTLPNNIMNAGEESMSSNDALDTSRPANDDLEEIPTESTQAEEVGADVTEGKVLEPESADTEVEKEVNEYKLFEPGGSHGDPGTVEPSGAATEPHDSKENDSSECVPVDTAADDLTSEEKVAVAPESSEVAQETVSEASKSSEAFEKLVTEATESSEAIQDPVIEATESPEVIQDSVIEATESAEAFQKLVAEATESSEAQEPGTEAALLCSEVFEEPAAATERRPSNETADEGITLVEPVSEIKQEEPIDQGKFKKKAALMSTPSKSDDSNDDVQVVRASTSFLPGISRTGRIIKRIKFSDTVEGLELDKAPSGKDIVMVNQSPRPRPIKPIKPVMKTGQQMIVLGKPNILSGNKLAYSNKLVRTPVRGPLISLRKDLLQEVPPKRGRGRPPGKRAAVSYDSETEDEDDEQTLSTLLPTGGKRRKRPDDYWRSKYFIRPSFICLHDVWEFRGEDVKRLQKSMGKCSICQSINKPPAVQYLASRWLGAKIPASKPLQAETKKIILASSTPPQNVDPTSTVIYVNPCTAAPGSIMIRVSSKESTASFITNQAAFRTFAQNINSQNNPKWPSLPPVPRSIHYFTFLGGLKWQKYLPPVAELTPQQQVKMLQSIAPNVASKAVPTLPKSAVPLRVGGAPANSLQCCVSCSQVFRPDDGHKCPPKVLKKPGRPPAIAKQLSTKPLKKPQTKLPEVSKPTPNKVPSSRLKLCTTCNLVYSEEEEHVCGTKKFVKNDRIPTIPKPLPSTKNPEPSNEYKLCALCIEIYRDGEKHDCKKRRKRKAADPATPAADTTTAPKAKPKKKQKKDIFDVGSRSPSPELPEPEIMPDETACTMMCDKCSGVYLVGENHDCNETAEKPAEIIDVLCASCSTLYKSNEKHECPKPAIAFNYLDPVPQLPISEPKVSSSMPGTFVEEVFSLPALDEAESIADPLAPPVPSAKGPGTRMCKACRKLYKASMFAAHPCTAPAKSQFVFCRLCAECYPRKEMHSCGNVVTKKPAVDKILASDRVTSIKCKWCDKELLPSQMGAHDCPAKASSQLTYKCIKCPFTTLDKAVFTSHKCVESAKNIFKCDGCPKMFSKEEFLVKHQSNMCPGRQINCTGCGKAMTLAEQKTHSCYR